MEGEALVRAQAQVLGGLRGWRGCAAVLGVAVGSLLASTGARAQLLSVGERPYNSAIYKASHNSYARSESLAAQIDDFNVWQIELDVYDYGDLYVNHDCVAPFTGADTLQTLLQKLASESQTLTRKFTMIYLDMKGNGNDGCQIGWGPTLPQRLRDAFLASMTRERIYSSSEFTGTDGGAWPSYQELVRRGHHVGVIVDWHEANPTPSDDLFFFAGSANPPSLGLSANTVLVNVDGGCDDSPTGATAPAHGTRWLSRAYPAGRCSTDCLEMNGDYWTNILARGFTFLATNCVNWDHTFSPATQSPEPLFVEKTAAAECPRGYTACEWGTSRFPYHDLGAALDRASPMVTLIIGGGDYALTSDGTPRVIRNPMILTSSPSQPSVLH